MNKNVFILPTTEESNLAKNLDSDLFVKRKCFGNRFEVNQYIYITNEEDIEDGHWCFNYKTEDIVKYKKCPQTYSFYTFGWRRIVLTNDPTLIADGVQEIEKSVLISFAENSVDYLEVTKMLQVRYGVEWYDLPNQVEGGDSEGIYRTIYKLKYQPKTELVKLLNEFEILEGITPEQFDEKDWARFERFVKSRAEEDKIEEKLYTKEQLKGAFDAGMNCPIAGATFEEWLEISKTQ